jgi:hypothetical protein
MGLRYWGLGVFVSKLWSLSYFSHISLMARQHVDMYVLLHEGQGLA